MLKSTFHCSDYIYIIINNPGFTCLVFKGGRFILCVEEEFSLET